MKTGLVLEGGGVKGAYQAGVLKAISESGVEFDGAVGTSIGAVNSALYIEGGVNRVLDMWANINLSTVLDIDRDVMQKLKHKDLDAALVKYIGKQIISINSLVYKSALHAAAFLRGYISEEGMRNSKKDFGCAVYCLSDKKGLELMKEDIDEGELIDFVIASATYPIFPPKVIRDKKYIDGGVFDNMPSKLLKDRGYDRLVFIRTNMEDKVWQKKQDMNDKNSFFIIPKMDLGHAMNFTSERVAKFLALGYEDGKAAISGGLADFLSK